MFNERFNWLPELFQMTRVTVTLADDVYRALKDAARREHRSMGAIVEECQARRGIRSLRPCGSSRDIVARARAASGLDADEATNLAFEETRRFREARSVPLPN